MRYHLLYRVGLDDAARMWFMEQHQVSVVIHELPS